jgi:hypothetical protein
MEDKTLRENRRLREYPAAEGRTKGTNDFHPRLFPSFCFIPSVDGGNADTEKTHENKPVSKRFADTGIINVSLQNKISQVNEFY